MTWASDARKGAKSVAVPASTADNCEDGPRRILVQDDSTDRPDAQAVDPGLEMREPYLRRVLADFEAGQLEPYEYTRRVLAINAATSTEEMSAIVNTPPVRTDGSEGSDGSDRLPPAADGTLLPGLDPVDLARLRATRLAESRSPNAALRHPGSRVRLVRGAHRHRDVAGDPRPRIGTVAAAPPAHRRPPRYVVGLTGLDP